MKIEDARAGFRSLLLESSLFVYFQKTSTKIEGARAEAVLERLVSVVSCVRA